MIEDQNRLHWPSIAQFGFSGCGMVVLLSLAAGLLATAVLAQFQNAALPVDPTTLWLALTGTAFAGLLLLPSTLLSFLRIIRRTAPRLVLPIWSRRMPPVVLVVWMLAVLAGYWVTNRTDLGWVLLPPLYLLGVGLPVAILVWVAGRGLQAGSPQRQWGLFTSGLMVGPTVVVSIEIGIALVGVVVLILYVIQDPQLTETLNILAQRLLVAQDNPEAIARILRPYLSHPLVLFVAFTFFSVLAPLVEEALKPLGMWLLAGRKLTPGAGFVSGALCGAGFALFESLTSASSLASGDWAALALARAGTDVMHIFTSGLVGLGLATAWRSGQYLRLVGAYLLAVLIHGTWNGLSLLIGLRGLSESGEFSPSQTLFGGTSSLALVGLIIALLAGLVLVNTRLHRQTHMEAKLNSTI